MPPSRFLQKGYKARKYKENEDFKGMIKILFVCHGNICRSPMAEFVLKDMIKERHLDDYIYVESAATSSEELGNPVHPGTRKKLAEVGISVAGKCARQIRPDDYEKFDYLIGMDQRNVQNMYRVFGKDEKHKVCRLLDYTENARDIADPWYSGDFDATYRDVFDGCVAFLEEVLNRANEEK